MKRRIGQQGFTLLELVVVIAVLGLITSMATEFVAFNTNQQRLEHSKQKRVAIRDAIHYYYKHCGGLFPEELRDLISNPASTASASVCAGWNGPYILDVDFGIASGASGSSALYRDGWGNISTSDDQRNYGWVYQADAASVALVSLGMDGVVGHISPAGTDDAHYEQDYPPIDFVLTTASAASSAAASLP